MREKRRRYSASDLVFPLAFVIVGAIAVYQIAVFLCLLF